MMARFDVFENPDTQERVFTPYFLDVQSDFLRSTDTRVMVPLNAHVVAAADRLNPRFVVRGDTVTMDAAAIGAVPVAALRGAIANLRDQQFAIQDALDTLLGGY